MPISSDPNARAEYVLLSDRRRFAGNPTAAPVFYSRYFTVRQDRQREATLNTARSEARARGDQGIFLSARDTVVLQALTGWANLTDLDGKPVAYSPARSPAGTLEILYSVLTDDELTELADCTGINRPCPAEKKTSGSPSSTDSAASAPAAGSTAAATTAAASSVPAPPSPSSSIAPSAPTPTPTPPEAPAANSVVAGNWS
jgi:hypothetical protein